MKTLLQICKEFSRKNYWVFILLFLCLCIIWYTGRGSVIETIIIFVIYFLGDLFVLLLIYSLQKKDTFNAAIFQGLSQLIFTGIALYGYLGNNQPQYLLFNLAFVLGTIKNVLLYLFSYNLKFLRWEGILLLNICIFGICIFYGLFHNFFQNSIQAIGMSFWSTALIMNDTTDSRWKYIFGIIGAGSITGGGLSLLLTEIFSGQDILGITICFFLMPLTVFIYFLGNYKKSTVG